MSGVCHEHHLLVCVTVMCLYIHTHIHASMVSCMTEYVWVHVCDSEMYSGKSDIFVPSDLLYNVWKVCVCVHACIHDNIKYCHCCAVL